MKHEIRKITKLGNSIVITVPARIVKKFGLKEGDYVAIYDDGAEIHILPL